MQGVATLGLGLTSTSTVKCSRYNEKVQGGWLAIHFLQKPFLKEGG